MLCSVRAIRELSAAAANIIIRFTWQPSFRSQPPVEQPPGSLSMQSWIGLSQKRVRIFSNHDVGHVVIRGIASVLHGVSRATFDPEIIVDATPENAQHL